MASTHATVLFDQADDPDVLFSNGELHQQLQERTPSLN